MRPPGLGVRLSPAAFLRSTENGLTLLEVLVVIAVVVILCGLLLPASTGGNKALPTRIKCVSQLKQVGLAFRVWEGDHGDHFPTAVYTNKSGGALYVKSPNLFRYFQVMSNELSNPAILICPTDTRIPSTNFTTDFDSTHISYFVGLNADDIHSQSFLAGDANITNGFTPRNGLLELTRNQTFGWTMERHNEAGNVALADGSVQQFSSSAMRNALKQTGLATNLLLMPEKNPAQ